ncbi:MAG TPA: DNA-3-methyladenine glycosylase 2 family protein [Thermodesulfobacteriota bacterium]|nr:DNA-3-methyladenine glycosylase 2 family protein [Thermodesulfobacteriota bacterium]
MRITEREITLPKTTKRLTRSSLSRAVRILTAQDPDLAKVVARFGPPPLWERAPGFPALILIILEQQVSLSSARAAYARLQEAAGEITPENFLKLGDAELKAVGFSRQKAGYSRALAAAVVKEEFDISGLSSCCDVEAKERLMRMKGIGSWSADVYLMMSLGRPDVWPSGDLALATAVQAVKRMRRRPDPARLEEMGRAWQPWRAVAARIFWHFYLSGGLRLKDF